MRTTVGLVTLGLCAISIATDTSAQAPEDCSPEMPTLHVTSDAAANGSITARLLEGESAEFTAEARLRSNFSEASGQAVQGFSIAVAQTVGVLEILDVTIQGTDNELYFQGAFHKTEVTRKRDGFVAAAVGGGGGFGGGGSFGGPFPPQGDFSLARARYRILPADRASPVVSGAIEYLNGLQGSGQPVANALTVEGSTWTPCTEPLPVKALLVESFDFSRGDANNDSRHDISDPVTVLRASFFGDAKIYCDDAADSNDDGRVDISDAIFLFGYLFLGGPPPSAPFPRSGSDPTADVLGCRPGDHDVFEGSN